MRPLTGAIGLGALLGLALLGGGPVRGQGQIARGGTLTPDTVTYAQLQNVSSASRLIGRGTAGAGDPEELTLGPNLSLAGTTLSATGGGVVVQVVTTQTGALASGTTILPLDDTIPQNTEGDPYLSLAITPTSSANALQIDVVAHLAHSVVNAWMTAALFQDTTANALAVGVQTNPSVNGNTQLRFSHRMTAGTTAATTFTVRAGANGAGTTTFNGRLGARLFGGVLASSLTITELVP